MFRSSNNSDASQSLQNIDVNDKIAVSKQSSMSVWTGNPSPLHNFPLSNLRWHRPTSSNSTQRIRRRIEKSPIISPTDVIEDIGTDGRGRIYDVATEKEVGKTAAFGIDCVDNQNTPHHRSTDEADDDDGEETTSKVWNLRPRKPGRSVVVAAQEIKSKNSSRSEGNRHRTGVDAKMAAETKERMRFSLSLTKEEIEEDFFLMTGAKPSRRPTRRNKQVQKQINDLYPGSWLEAPLPEMYKTSTTSRKG